MGRKKTRNGRSRQRPRVPADARRTQNKRKVDAERTQAGRTRGRPQTQNARKLPAGRTRFLTSYFLAVLYIDSLG